MISEKGKKLIRETIEFPVQYDRTQQTIRDAKKMMVCDIRGWGKIQYMNKAEKRQDAIGELVAKLLNEYHFKENLPCDDELLKEEMVFI
ncbi:hypothetical protein [Autumnicola edwardsiae]|uniref:Uncharacterized protein n=1 Tax=Autumnicola edwardsiae TaxID=3075594 RepID=A0ABU3CUS3_9FLAO|nr:hypothetical protein [Zunongwangia sp. F297]MDT0650117.1 hypothetical protein [Zunongwangia sp. F297]